jgi:hypothetical protein
MVEYYETFSFDECQKNPTLRELLEKSTEVADGFSAMYPTDSVLLSIIEILTLGQAQVGGEIFELIKTARRQIASLADEAKSGGLQALTKFTKAASILNDAERQVLENPSNISAMLQLVVSAKFLVPTLADVLGNMFGNRLPPEVLKSNPTTSTRLSEVPPPPPPQFY